MDCCNGSKRAGNWYFPDMTLIESFTDNEKVAMRRNFFYRNRGDRVVRLLIRRIPTERGLFYCQVPDTNNVNQTIYVNIGM